MTTPMCGDGTRDPGESCDDGNIRDRDGCSSTCQMERGLCGDGIVQSALGEECDDGNRDNDDDCSIACRWSVLPTCGDGIIEDGMEQCDAGIANGDYLGTPCHSNCVEPRCGDGLVDGGEDCDDGNNLALDGCSASCTREVPAAANVPIRGSLVPPESLYSVPPPSNRYEQVPTFPNIPTPARTPTGPGLVIFLATGAAAGVGLIKRKIS